MSTPNRKRKLDDWIGSFLEFTENSEPPTSYREWVAVSVIAAALRRKCFLPWGPITFYPNMYIVLVGPPGGRKGTAMGVGARFLKDLGIKLAAEAITREALIRELNESSDTIIDPSMAHKPEFHASLTIYSQELAVFLGRDNEALMSDLTDWYDCRDRWTYRTKSMGTDEIIGVWVNLIGATTPKLIQAKLPQDAIGGGLTSRMIFVVEQGKEKVVPFPFLSKEAIAIGEDLKHDLDIINELQGAFEVTQEFLGKYQAWYHYANANPPFPNNPKFEGYTERRPNHLLKLCIILSASSRNDMKITSDIFDRAADMLKRVEKNMERTFIGHGQSALAGVEGQLIEIIRARKKLPLSDVVNMFHTDVKDMDELRGMLTKLQAMNFITMSADASGKTWIQHNPNHKP